MNTSKLVNGLIPARTECPFRAECPVVRNCCHKGTEHPVDFSCACARFCDTFQKKGLPIRSPGKTL